MEASPGEREQASGRIEYWTVAPNEGQSVGGHAALRLGDLVHHLEHRGDGLIVDRREPVSEFERRYRFLGNRDIEVLRLALPRAAEDRLRRTLEQRYHARRSRLAMLAGLEAEAAWLDRTLESGHAMILAPGLGILETGPAHCGGERGGGAASLRARIERELGAGRLDARLASARGAMHRARDRLMTASPAPSLRPKGELEARAGAAGGAVRRLAEAVQTVVALEAIRDCRGPAAVRIAPLASEASRVHDQGEQLAATQREWRAARESLTRAIARLVESRRTDPGLALILAWSRLCALDAAIESGRWRVLDPYAEAEAPIDLRSASVSADHLAARVDLARRRLELRAADFAGSPGRPLEQRLERLEASRHALEHALRGERHRPPARLADATGSVSERYAAAGYELPWAPGQTLQRLAARRDAAAARARTARLELEAELGYRLFTRNCVTELLDVLDGALAADPGTAGFGEARQRDLEAPTSFIPVVAGRIVARHAPLVDRRRLPGLRALEVERARGLHGRGWVAVRESNTLTSHSYRPHPEDSIFLFFSDGPVWLRPLAGLGNLLSGLGGAGAGLLSAPVDGGRRLVRGLEGMAMSVPELFFFSVRKGSYLVAPPRTAPLWADGSDDEGT